MSDQPESTPVPPGSAAVAPSPSPLPAVAPPVPGGPLVADASFILAVLEDHPGAAELAAQGVLARCLLPSLTYAEILTVLHRAGSTVDPAVLETGLGALGVQLVDMPAAAARHTPILLTIDAARRAEAHRLGHSTTTLSLGDRCLLSYALEVDLPVLTGDRHWTQLIPHGLTVEVHTYQQDSGS